MWATDRLVAPFVASIAVALFALPAAVAQAQGQAPSGKSAVTEADIERMGYGDWGMNLSRFLIQWQQLEPEPGVYDDAYLAQIQHEMFVANLDWAVIACLFASVQVQWYVVEKHEKFQATMLEKERAFWESIKAGKVPLPDPANDEEMAAYAKSLLTVEPGKVVELGGEFLELHHERILLNREIKEREKKVDVIKAKLQVAMGDAASAVITGTDVRDTPTVAPTSGPPTMYWRAPGGSSASAAASAISAASSRSRSLFILVAPYVGLDGEAFEIKLDWLFGDSDNPEPLAHLEC